MEIIIIILISVFIFSAQEMAALFPDRVIAIRGTIDNMCLAEAAISAKLQECYEQDQGQNMVATTFIHSGYFHCASSSPLRGAPGTARILCWNFTPKRHRQLRVKDLPKVPTWQLERDLNPRPF